MLSLRRFALQHPQPREATRVPTRVPARTFEIGSVWPAVLGPGALQLRAGPVVAVLLATRASLLERFRLDLL